MSKSYRKRSFGIRTGHSGSFLRFRRKQEKSTPWNWRTIWLMKNETPCPRSIRFLTGPCLFSQSQLNPS